MPTILNVLISHASTIALAMNLIRNGIAIAPELAEKIRVQAELIRKMVTENRDPTKEEWEAVNAEIATNQAILHAPDKA